MKIYEREAWFPEGVKSKSYASLDKTPKKEMFLHRSAFAGIKLDTWQEQIDAVYSIYKYHTGNLKWNDIAYSFLVCQPHGGADNAKIFEGRGWDRLPAAQAGHNSGTIAICVLTLEEAILPETVEALRFLYHHENNKAKVLRGHKDVVATSCPGPKLYELIPEIKKKPKKSKPDSSKPKPKPKPKPKEDSFKYPGPPVLRLGTRNHNVKKIQKQLKIKADGIFGSQTEREVKKFQQEERIKVDGIVGKVTWNRLFG